MSFDSGFAITVEGEEMVEIVEKEGWLYTSRVAGNCMMYPIFMLKDGKEYFVVNRGETDQGWMVRTCETLIAELLSNDGTYFRICGAYADPLEMLAEMERRGHTFSKPDRLFRDCRNNPQKYGEGFVDFCGNRKEIFSAFYYRIYDEALLEKIKKATAAITKRDGGVGDEW